MASLDDKTPSSPSRNNKVVQKATLLVWRSLPLVTHQYQFKPCRGSRRVASITERLDLGYASNPMRVSISFMGKRCPGFKYTQVLPTKASTAIVNRVSLV